MTTAPDLQDLVRRAHRAGWVFAGTEPDEGTLLAARIALSQRLQEQFGVSGWVARDLVEQGFDRGYRARGQSCGPGAGREGGDTMMTNQLTEDNREILQAPENTIERMCTQCEIDVPEADECPQCHSQHSIAVCERDRWGAIVGIFYA